MVDGSVQAVAGVADEARLTSARSMCCRREDASPHLLVYPVLRRESIYPSKASTDESIHPSKLVLKTNRSIQAKLAWTSYGLRDDEEVGQQAEP